MHPENLERGSLGVGMVFPFVMGNLTFAVAFFYLLVRRWEVENLRAQAAREAWAEEERRP
jgi:hypothetical protein